MLWVLCPRDLVHQLTGGHFAARVKALDMNLFDAIIVGP